MKTWSILPFLRVCSRYSCRGCFFVALVLLTLVSLGSSLGSDPKNVAAPAAAKPQNPPGALVIVGGGTLPTAVLDRFLDLAGGKNAKLVIIPTANAKADSLEWKGYASWQAQPVASVKFLHTRSKAQANEADFVKPLADATGVWFSGGDQSRIVDSYKGTAVEAALRQLLARGGVIGGTSAGAAIMSSVMILGGDVQPLVGRGFGFLPGEVVVDQHFSNRKRMSRLLWVLDHNPHHIGVGIDEETAIVVRGRTITVLGDQKVHFCAPGNKQPHVQVLQNGDQADLPTLYETVTHAREKVVSDK